MRNIDIRCAGAVVLMSCGVLMSGCGPVGTVRNGLRTDFAIADATLDAGVAVVGNLRIDGFTLHISELVFDAEGPAGSVSISNSTQVTVDVVAGVSRPELVVELAQGSYQFLNLGLELDDRGPDPALRVEGQQSGVDFRLDFNSAEVFEAGAAAFEMPDGVDVAVTFELDLITWFAGVDVSQGTPDAGGVVVISDSQNGDFFDLIATRIEDATDGEFPGD